MQPWWKQYQRFRSCCHCNSCKDFDWFKGTTVSFESLQCMHDCVRTCQHWLFNTFTTENYSLYKERAHFARSLLAPVSKHIAYFTHINIASSVDTYQVHQLALAENVRACSVNEQEKVVQAINSLLKRTS